MHDRDGQSDLLVCREPRGQRDGDGPNRRPDAVDGGVPDTGGRSRESVRI